MIQRSAMDARKKEVRSPNLVKGVLVALAVLATVAAITIAAVYLSQTMAKVTYKEAWNTVQDEEGHYVEEKVNKTEDTVEVDVPNSVQIIYDYTNEIAVYRYTHVQTRIRGPCYVREIDSDVDPKPLSYETESERPMLNEFSETTRQWKFTDRKVSSYKTSSSRVQDMCRGTDIYWMEVMPDSNVQKRQVSTRELIRIIPINFMGKPCFVYVYIYRNAFGFPHYMSWVLVCPPSTTTTTPTTTTNTTTNVTTTTTPATTSNITNSTTTVTTTTINGTTTTTPPAAYSTTTSAPSTPPCPEPEH